MCWPDELFHALRTLFLARVLLNMNHPDNTKKICSDIRDKRMKKIIVTGEIMLFNVLTEFTCPVIPVMRAFFLSASQLLASIMKSSKQVTGCKGGIIKI